MGLALIFHCLWNVYGRRAIGRGMASYCCEYSRAIRQGGRGDGEGSTLRSQLLLQRLDEGNIL